MLRRRAIIQKIHEIREATMTDLEKLEAEYRRVKEKADAAKAKAKAKLDRAKARNAEKLRKMETKAKIIGGGLLFKMAADGNAAALEVMRELYRQMKRDEARKADKAAFESFQWPQTNAAASEGGSAPE